MSILKPKRFWKSAKPVETDGGWKIELDGRPVRSPAKTLMVVPSLALAEAIAAEWDAQEEEVDPNVMPFTRMANSALDKVATQHVEVADMLAEYGGSDLLCYRATTPQALVSRQAEAWDPVLEWSAAQLGVQLNIGEGIIFVAQSDEALAHFREQVRALSDFHLAAFHDLVALSGSLVLAFAAAQNYQPIDEIWQLSRIDERWQEEQWGEDDEATALAEIKRTAFHHAKRFYDLCSA
ncbi:MAG: ATPase [Thalassovita sp.]